MNSIGLMGLGQCTTDSCVFDDTPTFTPVITPLPDLPSAPSAPALTLPTLSSSDIANLGTPATTTQVTNSMTGQPMTVYQYASGEIVDSNGNIIQGPTSGCVPGVSCTAGQTPGTAGSGVNLAQLLGSAASAATTAVKLNQSLQTPGLIPGTSLVYNPATGQITNALGTAQQISSSLGSILPLLLLAGGAFLLIEMMEGGHR
jgi:hypothetical protein